MGSKLKYVLFVPAENSDKFIPLWLLTGVFNLVFSLKYNFRPSVNITA